MKVLVVVPTYPHPGHPFSGIFNERAVQALRKICDAVEVLVPRPYVPPFFSWFVPRWKAYRAAAGQEIRNDVSVYRPAIPVIPRVGGAYWLDQCAYTWSRRTARIMNDRIKFDAVLSFDLAAAGGIAWRIGRDLRIPACGWATGGDIRVTKSRSCAGVVIRSLKNLDLVFYQSYELLEKAAGLLGMSVEQLPVDRHVVLPRGIPEPPLIPQKEVRKRIRGELGIGEEKILVLGIGRITGDKGIFELLDAISLAASQNPRIICVLVGSLPAFDETTTVERHLNRVSHLREKVRILPACSPEMVWEYLCAADIFAFPSHHEGMPNSLLEAMVMEIPAIAFTIPPVKELEGGTGGLITVPPFDATLFADGILKLANNADARALIGQKAKARVTDAFMAKKNMAEAMKRFAQVKQNFQNKIGTDVGKVNDAHKLSLS